MFNSNTFCLACTCLSQNKHKRLCHKRESQPHLYPPNKHRRNKNAQKYLIWLICCCTYPPLGTYCPYKKMSEPLPCPVGHYSDISGQIECKKCHGPACKSTVTPSWSKGQSQLGQRSRQLISCPTGTYRDGERSDCVVCPIGELPSHVGLVHFVIWSWVPHFTFIWQDIIVLQTLRYNVQQEPMDRRRAFREKGTALSVLQVLFLHRLNYIQISFQLRAICSFCFEFVIRIIIVEIYVFILGFYCLEGTSRRPSSQFLCPEGYYCEEGTGVPHGSPCPAGTAGGQLGQTSRAACKRCAEGRFCPTGKDMNL